MKRTPAEELLVLVVELGRVLKGLGWRLLRLVVVGEGWYSVGMAAVAVKELRGPLIPRCMAWIAAASGMSSMGT